MLASQSPNQWRILDVGVVTLFGRALQITLSLAIVPTQRRPQRRIGGYEKPRDRDLKHPDEHASP